jgi:hypothetical protein
MPQNFATNGIARAANTYAIVEKQVAFSRCATKLLVSRMGSPVFSPLPERETHIFSVEGIVDTSV